MTLEPNIHYDCLSLQKLSSSPVMLRHPFIINTPQLSTQNRNPASSFRLCVRACGPSHILYSLRRLLHSSGTSQGGGCRVIVSLCFGGCCFTEPSSLSRLKLFNRDKAACHFSPTPPNSLKCHRSAADSHSRKLCDALALSEGSPWLFFPPTQGSLPGWRGQGWGRG